MTNPGKGGRGKNAPYETTHYRIPEPIKPTVEKLANAYRLLVIDENSKRVSMLLENINSVIASISGIDKYQITLYDAIIEQLQADLATAKEQIEQLKTEREKAISILVPALQMKSREGIKMKEVIRQSFPELAEK